MIPVWEEQWSESDGVISVDQRDSHRVYAKGRFAWEQEQNLGAFGDLSGAAPFNPEARDVGRARLAAQAPRMARVLLELERVAIYCCSECPTCHARVTFHTVSGELKHKTGCEFDAALREAGIRS